MGDILRRREMMVQAGASPEWDYEWDVDDGSLDNNGFTFSTSGTSTITLGTESTILVAKGGTDSYARVRYPQNYTSGVLEARIRTGSRSNWYSYISLSNGTNSISVRPQVSSGVASIYLCNASSRTDMTVLGSCAASTYYTIKLVLNNGYGDVYIDDVLKASHVDVTTILKQQTHTGVILYAGSTSTYQMNIYSLKMKFNRIS